MKLNYIRVRIFILFAFLAGLFQPTIMAQAAVTLVSLTANPDESSTRIIVSWATGSELNSSGFFVLRSAQQNGPYTRLNSDQIPSSGEVIGSEYTYFDVSALDCVEYFYRLEAIDNSGNSLIYERDPSSNEYVSANLDRTGNCVPVPTATSTNVVTATPTRTATATITPTFTNTPVGFTASPSPSPTVTRTPTATPTNTPVGFTASLTPSLTPTQTPRPSTTPTSLPTSTLVPQPSLTPTLPTAAVGQITATNIPTPTTTLEPLPTMQLVFPSLPTERPVTPGVTVIVVTPTPSPLIPVAAADISSQLMLLVGIVIVLWIGLMAFLVIFLKKSSQ